MKLLQSSLIILILTTTFVQGAIGQSAIITLAFPHGARNMGMGETGVALADDLSASFFNPAGFGMYWEQHKKLTTSLFYEELLPKFNLDDLWHSSFATSIPLPRGEYLDSPLNHSAGFFINYLNFGMVSSINDQGETEEENAFEFVIGISYGFQFSENLYLGTNLKFAHSNLDTRDTDLIGSTFAIDLGLLYKLPHNLQLGFALQNMGPPLSYDDHRFGYNMDPIPFTIRGGIAYKSKFPLSSGAYVRLNSEYSMNLEMVNKNPGEEPDPFFVAIFTMPKNDRKRGISTWEQVIHNIGLEVNFINTIALRTGYMIDTAGQRKEFRLGGGLSFLNHIQGDFFIILAGKYSEARHLQWGFNITLNNLLDWGDDDFQWYLQ